MTLTKHFYSSIFISLIIGCFFNSTSMLLLLPIPLLLITRFTIKRNSIILLLGLTMSFGFSSFYTNLKLDHIKKTLETRSNTLIGQFLINQGKVSFQSDHLLSSNKWIPHISKCSIINPPDDLNLDSTYLIKGKLYPIKPDYFTSLQMTFSSYSKDKLFRIYLLDKQAVHSNNNPTTKIKQELNQSIDSNFNQQSSSYLKGILLGNKSELVHYTAIQNIGIAHLFAASGYHVGILYGIIFLIFSITPKFKHKPLIEFSTALIIIWMYAAILDYSPSILRASSLFTFIGMLRVMNRTFSMIELLSLIGIIMVIYNPLITHNISFQLSFLAVYSILLFFPLIRNTYSKDSKLFTYPLDILNVSVSAQILTMPVSLYYFNQFPVYSLLSNITIAPLVSITIPLSALSLFLNSMNLPNEWVTYLVNTLFRIIDFLITRIDSFPNKVIKDVFLNTEEVIILLLLIIVFYSLIAKNKSNPILKMTLLCFLLITFKIERSLSNSKFNGQDEMYITTTKQSNNFYYVKNNILYAFESRTSSYLISRIKQKHHLITDSIIPIEKKNFNMKINDLNILAHDSEFSITKNNILEYSSQEKITQPKHLVFE